MKKQIFGCFVILALSATAIPASKKHVNMNMNSHSPVTDTLPNDSSGWNKNDTSMYHMQDTAYRTNRDSTLQ